MIFQNRKFVIGILIVVIIIVGVFSRIIHIGSPIWDHYLGDALYAAMFYLIMSLFFGKEFIVHKFLLIFIFMLGIELFQLTNIPLSMFQSKNLILKVIGILLGTKFEWLEIFSYFVGLIATAFIEYIAT